MIEAVRVGNAEFSEPLDIVKLMNKYFAPIPASNAEGKIDENPFDYLSDIDIVFFNPVNTHIITGAIDSLKLNIKCLTGGVLGAYEREQKTGDVLAFRSRKLLIRSIGLPCSRLLWLQLTWDPQPQLQLTL